MQDSNSTWIILAFSIVPYALVAWSFKYFSSGDTELFWVAFGLLIGCRVFFVIIETIGSVLKWHFYGKDKLTKLLIKIMQDANFPQIESIPNEVEEYLHLIANDFEIKCEQRLVAKQLEAYLEITQSIGMLAGLRIRNAAQHAYEATRPKL